MKRSVIIEESGLSMVDINSLFCNVFACVASNKCKNRSGTFLGFPPIKLFSG
jgi:hypothetical protein